MRALVALSIALLLAGCTQTDMTASSFLHSYDEGAPRVMTFDLPGSVTRIEVRIEITGQEEPMRCTVRESPIRAALLDPTAREVVSVEVDGAALPTGGNACTATNAQREHDARGGTWTVSFSGSGDLRATVEVKPLD